MPSCSQSLPNTQRFPYSPYSEIEGDRVDFRLVYRGPLASQGSGDSRAKEKHLIRKELHPQLRELWSQNVDRWGAAIRIAKDYDRCGYHFAPAVRRKHLLDCSLNILFLRRDSPGNIVRSGGDIDNRLKVLFDGLRMPHECSELGGCTPGEGEDPFYCLLEDDSLITEVQVTTDRLLVPQVDNEHIHVVVLIIQVKTNYETPSMDEMAFTQHYALRSYLKHLDKES